MTASGGCHQCGRETTWHDGQKWICHRCLTPEDKATMRERMGFALPNTDPDRRPPGRNRPCPCGSGKRYKRCCGRNDAPDRQQLSAWMNRGFDEE